MALEGEEVGDAFMNGEELLGLPGRFDSMSSWVDS